tara:strand:+ start:377 stop:592 length:216 start_codon:yes stop_codon:yes gene_type:complete
MSIKDVAVDAINKIKEIYIIMLNSISFPFVYASNDPIIVAENNIILLDSSKEKSKALVLMWSPKFMQFKPY